MYYINVIVKRPTTNVQIVLANDEMTRETAESIRALALATWPSDSGSTPGPIEKTLDGWKRLRAAHFLITYHNEVGGEVLAHAQIFPREILTARGPLLVGALAAVCVNAEYRGRGWGADVVQAAFDYLPELGADVSLFQTGVPGFYEKLGCRLVGNTFVNGDDAKDPFWDAHKMIYPGTFDWPDGQINLNGRGY